MFEDDETRIAEAYPSNSERSVSFIEGLFTRNFIIKCS